jgi:hypothetical protein
VGLHRRGIEEGCTGGVYRRGVQEGMCTRARTHTRSHAQAQWPGSGRRSMAAAVSTDAPDGHRTGPATHINK